MQAQEKLIWRSPEKIVEIAFQRAPVVMMNEAHSGLKRCIRTRQIGKRILPVAHQAGVRHLAMEALFPAFVEYGNRTRQIMEGNLGYLSQPEMKDLIQTALDLGWTLIPYEADQFKWLSEKHGLDFSTSDGPDEKFQRWQQFQSEFTELEFTNWREKEQALNIIKALQSLPENSRLLVWCGNSHHSKQAEQEWIPMGYQVQQHSSINPFVIDQIGTVKFDDSETWSSLLEEYAHDLQLYGGTAGFLAEEAPDVFGSSSSEDAFLLSTENELE